MTLTVFGNTIGSYLASSVGGLLSSGLALLAGWLLAGLLVRFGARLLGLAYVTYGCAFYAVATASVAASMAVYVSVQLFSDTQVAGVSGGALVGLLITWLVMKRLLNTTMGRAMTIWVFDALAHLIVGLVSVAGTGSRVDLTHLLR